jgi:thiol-disulfide isomerase/thioredoxin
MTLDGEPIEVVHDQTIRLGELRIAAEFGVAEDLGLAVTLPLRVVKTSITYRDEDGDPVAIADGDVHHRDETLKGLADPWLLAHRHIALGGWSVELRGGVSLPLGKTEENPFTAEAQTRPHQHVQFGTGTINPIIGVSVGRRLLGAHLLTQQIIYENDKGYMAGDRYVAGISIGLPRWGFQLESGADVQIETAERWDSVIHHDDGNQGRLDVLLGGRIARAIGKGIDAHIGVNIPVYTHVVGGQLDYQDVLEVGISGAFELGENENEDEHEHEHAHEHAAAPAGPADVADLVTAGEATPLAPVPGKITVFDFWAPWCHPCHDLDRMLRVLAARHPDRLAVRRINIVDWDTPAAERYLTPGGFNLPHLKVLGPDGRLLLERSAPPHDLVRDLEALLAE